MSEDADLGHGANEALPQAKPMRDSGVHFAMSASPSAPQTEHSVRIKMLPGSGVWKKGPMQTFGPKIVTIKAGQSVIVENTDVGMAHWRERRIRFTHARSGRHVQ
jgi:hypothetical protein